MPDARRVAVDALVRIDQDGAYANLVLPKLLERSKLSERDRAFATQLVYGTVRARRKCDWFVDRFALGDLDPHVRAALRLGTYQLRVLGTPAHAAVSATVDTVPRRARGLVNAVLRKVAEAEDAWPSEAVRLSYPDWVLDRLTADLGADDALGALEAMNGAAAAVERPDGYTQDQASQWVAHAVGAQAGELVLDLCAAPGGKATALAQVGATVVAADRRAARVGLIVGNRGRVHLDPSQVPALVADGLHPPFAPATVRPGPGGCALLGPRLPATPTRRSLATGRRSTRTPGRAPARPPRVVGCRWCAPAAPSCTRSAPSPRWRPPAWPRPSPPSTRTWSPVDVPGSPWRPWGTGALLLPQAAGTDGMALFIWRAPRCTAWRRDPGARHPGGPGMAGAGGGGVRRRGRRLS